MMSSAVNSFQLEVGAATSSQMSVLGWPELQRRVRRRQEETERQEQRKEREREKEKPGGEQRPKRRKEKLCGRRGDGRVRRPYREQRRRRRRKWRTCLWKEKEGGEARRGKGWGDEEG